MHSKRRLDIEYIQARVDDVGFDRKTMNVEFLVMEPTAPADPIAEPRRQDEKFNIGYDNSFITVGWYS